MQGSEFPAHEALVFHGSAEAIKTFMSAKDRDKQKVYDLHQPPRLRR
ncbi:hypothetical protein L3476_24940 [Paenibacillus thiaminolyticus]|nr:hypothetical protein [Paenibacillus thiaminolyticus]WCR26441.1 hypothetical protein L3476_24940 [Paenibacillus thiaminolyticus]